MIHHGILIGFSGMEQKQSETTTTLTTEDILHVANLARLALSKQEIETAKIDLSAIFTHIDRLLMVDTTGVEPLDHPTELQNRNRDDDVGSTLTQQQVLNMAPAVRDVYIDVPKVLGGDT